MKTRLKHNESGHSRPVRSSPRWWTGASVFLIALTGLTFAQESAPKEWAGWAGWAAWAEKHHPVTDAQGHGPDIGSDEWANALARRLGVVDAAGHGPDLKSEEWLAAVEKKLLPKEEREALSAHDTIARFTELKDHSCLGLTSLCPDSCGHSGKLATFEITEYLKFEKNGEFGDPKQDHFQVLIQDNRNNLKISPEIHNAILALKPGDSVRLKWSHDYVTRDGSKFPERVITSLEKI